MKWLVFPGTPPGFTEAAVTGQEMPRENTNHISGPDTFNYR